MEWPNLASMLFAQADRLGDRPAFWAWTGGAWTPTTWRETAERAGALARALRADGLGKGDRVLLLAANGPEWAIADFAVMAAGGVTVPAYTTGTAADVRHVLEDSGARFAFTDGGATGEKFLEAAAGNAGLRRAVALGPLPERAGGPALETWEDALGRGRSADGDPRAWADAIGGDEVACIIYTSGTDGTPRGVMLSHRSVFTNIRGAMDLLEAVGRGEETFLSFLPLSHSYEHSCGLMFPVAAGAQIYYAESLDTLARDFVEVRPTVLTVVPRLLEVMRQRILAAVARQGGFRAWLFGKAVELGRRRIEGRPRGLSGRMLDPLCDALVRRRARARFGGRLKAMVSGGAPLGYEVGIFFSAFGLRLLQGYGQTEAGPVISCNPPDRVRLRTVGPALADVEVRIAPDGEILVRGPLLMEGYWNRPEETARTIRDGWLHTGDVGRLDDDGYLEITDRKKDLIVVAGGDNVAPQRVEGALTLQPEIEQAMVAGDRRPYLVGVVVPSPAFVEDWARARGVDPELAPLAEDGAFHEALRPAVRRANETLAPVERVRRFLVAGEAFTVDNGMMTPTMKVRRHRIRERYGERLEALY